MRTSSRIGTSWTRATEPRRTTYYTPPCSTGWFPEIRDSQCTFHRSANKFLQIFLVKNIQLLFTQFICFVFSCFLSRFFHALLRNPISTLLRIHRNITVPSSGHYRLFLRRRSFRWRIRPYAIWANAPDTVSFARLVNNYTRNTDKWLRSVCFRVSMTRSRLISPGTGIELVNRYAWLNIPSLIRNAILYSQFSCSRCLFCSSILSSKIHVFFIIVFANS